MPYLKGPSNERLAELSPQHVISTLRANNLTLKNNKKLSRRSFLTAGYHHRKEPNQLKKQTQKKPKQAAASFSNQIKASVFGGNKF